MPDRPLFLDLDGVLADFDRGVQLATGKLPHELPVKAMWQALAKVSDFYGNLALMPDAPRLWAFCQPHQPTILTGLPLGRWAEAQKRRWVAKVLGPDVPVITCMSRDKQRFAVPGAVLVDDRASIQPAWEAAGGAFVLHRDAETSIAALKRLGFAEPAVKA